MAKNQRKESNRNDQEVKPDGATDEKKFTKSAFLMAKKYKGKRDLLGVLLKDDIRYSNEDVETLVDNYLKKEN